MVPPSSKEKQEQCWLLYTYTREPPVIIPSPVSVVVGNGVFLLLLRVVVIATPTTLAPSRTAAASADRATYNTIPARRSFRLGRFNEYDAAASSARARAREADIDRELVPTYQSEWYYYYDDDDDELGTFSYVLPTLPYTAVKVMLNYSADNEQGLIGFKFLTLIFPKTHTQGPSFNILWKFDATLKAL